jgi:hypothetical protein
MSDLALVCDQCGDRGADGLYEMAKPICAPCAARSHGFDAGMEEAASAALRAVIASARVRMGAAAVWRVVEQELRPGGFRVWNE